jgi:hypothetical protein
LPNCWSASNRCKRPAAALRTKAQSRNAGKLDGLTVAETLWFVDKAADRLAKLEKRLQPTLFAGGGKESA